jgi:hypothetical protein
MKTINFCGDSFCRSGGVTGYSPDLAWTTLLAKQLDAKIIGLGKGGSAHEHAIQSFVDTADYTVFCWTEPHRLWHPKYGINMQTTDSKKKEIRIYGVADLYYKYLHNEAYAISRYQRECYWFENVVLSKYKHKLIHLNSFHNWYDWTSGIAHQLGPLNSLRTVPGKEADDEIANHLTKQQNEQLADELYYIFTKDIK